jgi:hypothetical protein
MPFDQPGKLLVIFGAIILVVGVVFMLLGRTPFGKLPGDITITTGNFTCAVPLVSMIVVSILLTIILNVVLRLFNR